MLNEEKTPKVSVVVPIFNRAKFLPALLAALEKQTISCEKVIVDDGSIDHPEKEIDAHQVILVRQENRGPAAARNLGAKVAKGHYLAFTDSDCLPYPNWIKRLLEGFDEETVGAVAGSYAIANPDSLLAYLIHEEIKVRHASFPRHIRAFGSYNVAFERNFFLHLGGFDESFTEASGEDNDLSYRILKAGRKIRFQPDALVAHFHQESLWAYLREQFRHGRWRMKLYRGHPEMMRGDDYTCWKDILEVPLAIMTMATLPLALSHTWRGIPAILSGLLLAMQGFMAGKIIATSRGPGGIWFAPMGYLRALSRGTGMLAGIYDFGLPPARGHYPLPSAHRRETPQANRR